MLPAQSQATVISPTKRGSKTLENFVIERGFTVRRVDGYTFMYRGQGDVFEMLFDLKYKFPVAYLNGWADVMSSTT